MSRFVLAARLHGHSSDVRAIASHTLSNGTQLILSGSRDQSARLWVRRHDGTHDVHVLDHGSGFVNAVAFFVHDTGIYGWDYLRELGRNGEAKMQAYLDDLAAKGLSRERGRRV